MEYQEIMKVLSDCGLGALVAADDWKICEVNEAAVRLLHGQEHNWLIGKYLFEIAEPLSATLSHSRGTQSAA